MTRPEHPYPTFAHRLAAATNSHDIDRLLACFTDDYVNETPVHPSRDFRGLDQVRRNWTRIFEGIPDIETTVLRADQVGDQVWSEWEMRGTRRDGTPHLVRGTMRFTVQGERASAVRFYLEPVERTPPGDGLDADGAVREMVVPEPP